VSPTDQANLTASQIAQLEQLTKDWNAANAAGDTAAMQAANAAANAIRASAGYSGGSNGNAIIVSSGNTTKIVVINDTTTVSNRGTIGTVNILAGASSAITNFGAIETINNSGTIGSIYNGYGGSIGTINNNNTGSIGTIINSGSIYRIDNNNGYNWHNHQWSVSVIRIGENILGNIYSELPKAAYWRNH
jgi:hypothetical protein